MLPLETKQYGGKLLPPLGSPGGGVFLEEASRSRQARQEDRWRALVNAVMNLRVP